MALTRALRGEVTFPTLRSADRSALYKRLWAISSDMTICANRLISALYLVKQGTLPAPLATAGKHVGQPTPLQSLSYQGLSGKWVPNPQHGPMYKPKDPGAVAGSAVLLETASVVFARLQTDYLDVMRGEKALSTFREMPIGVYNGGIKVGVDGSGNVRITLTVFEGRKNNKVTVQYRKLDRGQLAILRKIAAGTYKHGSARLFFAKRSEHARGKWMLSLSWTDPAHTVGVATTDAPVIASAHLGISNTVSMAYADAKTGAVQRRGDTIRFPEATVRAWNRLFNERRQRSQFNRDVYGLREGRGRARKLRAVDAIGDKVQRMTTTATRQTAAAVVNAAKAKGAVGIVWEDLHDWSVESMHAAADEMSNRNAAAHRRWYFQWHQGMLRDALASAAEREGLWFHVVDAKFTSRTCCECDTLWKDTGVYAHGWRSETPGDHGRWRWDRFKCTCGNDVTADRNAAVNVVKRGHAAWIAREAA